MDFFTLGARDRISKENDLLKLKELIDWSLLENHLVGIHKNEQDPKGGPKAYNTLSMFQALLLGQWHSLSDPGLEEALRVRLDFMLFAGFEMGSSVPDETTLCRFRNRLIELDIHEKLFIEVNRQLEAHGIKVREAQRALVDATVIHSSARPRRTIEEDRGLSQSADPDAAWLKKGKKSYFGYRGYCVTDGKEGFIHHVHVRPANESETKQLPSLLAHVHGEELLTDKGFSSHENRQRVKEKGIKDRLSYKASRGHPLSFSKKLFNKIVAKRRFIVERTFGTLKRKFCIGRASYFTRKKVEAQLYLKAICFNLNKALRAVSFRSVEI